MVYNTAVRNVAAHCGNYICARYVLTKFTDLITERKLDLWQRLKQSEYPIVLYGTGDGADKILDVLESRGIEVSGVFASDGFKKGKIFRGFEVVGFSDICERFGKFTVLMSFASSLEPVIENVKRISEKVPLYAPDVPVFGGGLFDGEYFERNRERLESVYNLLADDISRKTFVNAINYRLSGDVRYLFECESDIDEQYEIFVSERAKEGYADIGAYNGDTVGEFSSRFGNDVPLYAFEPDAKNFAKLTKKCGELKLANASLYNVAAWNEKCTLEFYSRSGRNSAATANERFGLKKVEINADRVDNLMASADGCGFVKIDAEGSEREVLEGMTDTLQKFKPVLKIAAYHRTDDYFAIPEKVLGIVPDYKVYMRHLRYIPCWDTDFIFVH